MSCCGSERRTAGDSHGGSFRRGDTGCRTGGIKTYSSRPPVGNNGRALNFRYKRSWYHQLTRAHTPDNVRRSLHRSASALRQKLHYAISFFLFHANPLRWALHGVSKVLFVLFALTGVSPSASQKPKITQEIHHCQVQAVLPEQKSVQAMKSPQAILCVLARALKRHGRFSARQNRVCPCQLMVGFWQQPAAGRPAKTTPPRVEIAV